MGPDFCSGTVVADVSIDPEGAAHGAGQVGGGMVDADEQVEILQQAGDAGPVFEVLEEVGEGQVGRRPERLNLIGALLQSEEVGVAGDATEGLESEAGGPDQTDFSAGPAGQAAGQAATSLSGAAR
jgi:hypothetical protein